MGLPCVAGFSLPSGSKCATMLREMAEMSDKKELRELAALMQAHGVSRCVISPGSRNAPLALTLSAVGMECRTVVDERSAGFVALGWAQQVKAPVAVCVTSGSAVLNLHPAVAEAYYRRIPLLLLTADRPRVWIGQQDGQTLPQPGAFGTLVRAAFNMPEGDASGQETNRIINEALLELRHRAGGPVQLNIPLSEPLFNTTTERLPQPRVIRRTELACMTADDEDALLARVSVLPRRMILVGQLPEEAAIPPSLVTEKQFATVGEQLSNSRLLCNRPDALLSLGTDGMAPDLLITVGGCIISKRLKQLLRNNPPKEHWHISPDGEVCDTFCALTHCIEGSADEVWDLLAAFADEGDEDYVSRWAAEPPTFNAAYCGMSAVGAALAALPEHAVLHLGNSSAVRYAQLFPLREGIHVECNRGVNGIEGCVSAALGFAGGDSRLQLLICGDLSFFYDMNALWMPGISNRVRILLLNNSCGGIFTAIGAPESPLVNAPHRATAEAWARSCGFAYRAVRREAELLYGIDFLLREDADSPQLLEVFTNAQEDAAILKQFYNNAAH